MNNAFDTLQTAADLVKKSGNSLLPNGKTLRETLIVDGVSFWNVAAPALAAYCFPKDLARKTPPTLFNRLCKQYLRLAKQRIKSLVPFPRSSDGCARWPSDPVCLFLGFSGYMYRDVLEQIKSRFDKNHEMNCVVLHDDARLQPTAVKLSGDGVQSLWDHWTPQADVEEKRIRQELRDSIQSVNFKNVLADVDCAEKGTVWPKIEPTFNWLFHVYLPSLVPYLALTRHILKEHHPTIIISPDVADPRTRLFCLAGRMLGIHSLEVQFGLYNKDSVEWQFFVADKVAVWGESARRLLTKTHSVPEDRIIITGSPRFDGLTKVSGAQITATRARLGIHDGKAMVLFASQYLLSYFREFGDYHTVQRSVKQAIFQVADRLGQMSLVVKPHPLENVQETKKLAEGCRNIVFVDKSEDIRELTKACDVFITLGSTATMEALVARKLVIFPSFPRFVWWDDMYLKNNVAVVVKSEEELENKLKEVVSGQRERLLDELEPARRRFLGEWVYKADGKATNRIADLAKQMAGLEEPK